MKWQHSAPANLALIKYMGKSNHTDNIASNASLSYTLPDLITTVEIESGDAKYDHWEPLIIQNQVKLQLSEQGIQRFLAHLSVLKSQFGYTKPLCVRSANNFPADCGLASSASSFAALTLCANIALSELTGHPPLSVNTLATLSRKASGSSCRSFFQPWCIWNGDEIGIIDTLKAPHPYHHLVHQVILINRQKKQVPSRLAHRRVHSSPLFVDRIERATKRQEILLQALAKQHWEKAYLVSFEEFRDMHDLFATSNPPFNYINEVSNTVLTYLQQYWQQYGDGPIITMDAGPNIHLLWRLDQTEQAAQCGTTLKKRGIDVI